LYLLKLAARLLVAAFGSDCAVRGVFGGPSLPPRPKSPKAKAAAAAAPVAPSNGNGKAAKQQGGLLGGLMPGKAKPQNGNGKAAKQQQQQVVQVRFHDTDRPLLPWPGMVDALAG
jgi:hypothetical protein